MRSRRKSADSYQYSPPPEIISAHHECLAQTPPTLAWRAREICGDAGIKSLRQRNPAAVGRDPGGLRSADPGYWCGPGGGECAQSPPALQCMKQYVPRRPHRATTVFTRCNVNIEDSLQALRPRHGSPAFCGCPIVSLAIGRSGSPPPPSTGCNLRSPGMVRRMAAPIEDHMRSTIPIQRFQLVPDLSAIRQRQALL